MNAMQQKVATIKRTIERLICSIRKKDQRFCARMEIDYTDTMAQCLIETEPEKMWGYSEADVDSNTVLVQLRFDGYAYEYFSYDGNMQSEGAWKLRKMLEKIGCSFEYYNSCSIDIYHC